MIAVLIEKEVHAFLNWGFAAALSAVLLTATLLVYAVLRRVLRGEHAMDMSRHGAPAGTAHAPPRRLALRPVRVVRAGVLLPDGAAAGRLSDLVQFFVVPSVPAAGLVVALVRSLFRRFDVDRRDLAQSQGRRMDHAARDRAGNAAGIQPGARALPRNVDAEPGGAAAAGGAAHRVFDRRLRPVRAAEAHRHVAGASCWATPCTRFPSS